MKAHLHPKKSALVAALLRLTLSVTSFSQATLANHFEMIYATGSSGGDAVWKVVSQSDQQATDLEPGVYSRGPDQSWTHPLVKGQILGRENASGLNQIPLTDITNRLEAWGVIDGKIHIFHMGTTTDDPHSQIIIGDDDYPLFDSVNTLFPYAKMPLISSLSDLTVVSKLRRDSLPSYDLLVSVKNNSAAYSDMTGITFIVQLSSLSTKNMKENGLELLAPIHILDYKFHATVAELNQLDMPHGYISLNYVAKLSQMNEDDPLPVRVWKNQLKSDWIHGNFHSLPLMNIESRDSHTEIKPEYVISSTYEQRSSLRAKAIYSLSGQPPKLQFQCGKEKLEMWGDINFLENSKQELASETNFDSLKKHTMFYSNNDSSALAFFNDQLHYIQCDTKNTTIIDIKLADLSKDQLPEDFSYITTDESEASKLILTSSRVGSDSKITAYKIAKIGKNFQLDKSFSFPSPYLTKAHLNSRLYENQGQIFFDIETQPKNQYDITLPHLDLIASFQKEKKVLGFRQALSSRKIIDNLVFNTFHTKGSPDFDGIYTTTPSSLPQLITNAELLFPDPDTDISEWPSKPGASSILESTTFVHEGFTISVSAIALDKDFEHGDQGFTLAYIFSTQDKKSAPIFKFYEINVPFSQFEKIIFHGANNSNGTVVGQNGTLETFLGSVAILRSHPHKANGIASAKEKLPTYQGEFFDFAAIITDRNDPLGPGHLKIDHRLSVSKTLTAGDEALLGTQTSEEWIYSPIALSEEHSEAKKIIYGEKLKPSSLAQAQQDEATACSSCLGFKSWDSPAFGKVQMSVYAIDEKFNHGQSGFTLIFKLYRENTRSVDYYAEKFFIPLNHLVTFRLQAPADFSETKDTFGIIYGIEPPFSSSNSSTRNSSAQMNPGFFSLFFNLKNDLKKSKFFPKPFKLALEHLEHPTDEEIDHKLRVDKHGKLYWPTNDLIPTHRNFQVIGLSDGEQLAPNPKNINLKTLKNIKEAVIQAHKEGSWRVRKGSYTSTKLPPLFDKLSKDEGELDEYRNLIFEDLGYFLEELGDASSAHQHAVMIVDNSIKSYVIKATAARWLAERDSESQWNHKNGFLALHYFHKTATFDQLEIFNNFSGMNEARRRNEKPVLVVDLAEFLSTISSGNIRQGNIEQPYQISYPEERSPQDDSPDGHAVLNGRIPYTQERLNPASLLYILASEGNVISLADFPHRGELETSIVLIGTQEEWRQAKEATNLHERRARLIENFREIPLETPTAVKRRNLMAKIFQEKSSLFGGITFDSKMIYKSSTPLSQTDMQAKVIDYAVSRSEALAASKGDNVFVSYVRLLNKLKDCLDPDELSEATHGPLVINKAFIEIMMSDLYGIPLNLHSLPATDPLKILSQTDAIDKLTEAGYSGSLPIKRKVISGILGQTNTGDQRTIPASFILFGKKGSGKTYLFKTLVNMLKLKRYSINGDAESNQGAQVFEINLGNVTSGLYASTSRSSDNEVISVGKLLEEFDKFIKSPKGKRGFILFDDAHLSSSEARSEIFSKLRSLFEAKDGRYHGINVRNLTLFMTFNPTSDLDKIKKVVARGEPTPVQLALATFMGDDNKVDESFFNRWGELINLDIFSTSAKSSELVNKVNETSKSSFNTENRFLTVTSDVITKISNRFPTLNARDFLSSAVKSIANLLPLELGEKPIYLVVPKGKLPLHGAWPSGQWDSGDNTSPMFHPSEASGEDVAAYIRQNFHTVIANENMRGFYYFLEMMTNNFRTNIYREVLKSLGGNKKIAGSNILQRHRYLPLLHAIGAHLNEHPKMPLTEFRFDQQIISQRLRLSHSGSFVRQINEMYQLSPGYSYFPEIFRRPSQGEHAAEYLTGKSSSIGEQPSRLHLLHETPKKLKTNLENYLHQLLFVKRRDLASSHLINDEGIRAWAEKLPTSDPTGLQREGVALTEALATFIEDFLDDPSLIENMQPEGYASASAYEAARIFFYTLDKAITLLDWEYPAIFILKALETMAQDGSLANLYGAQYWLFDAGKTVIRPVTLDSILESIKSAQAGLGENAEASSHSGAKRFYQNLGHLFFLDTEVPADVSANEKS